MVSKAFRCSPAIPLRGDTKIPRQRHATKPGSRHAERAGSPLTYPTGIGAPSSEGVSLFKGSVGDSGDQLRPADHLRLGAGEADVEPSIPREEHLVAGLDAA